jgi:hypothetical protein
MRLNYFGKIEYFCVIESDDFEKAEKDGLNKIETHFKRHKFLKNKYYTTFLVKKRNYLGV